MKTFAHWRVRVRAESSTHSAKSLMAIDADGPIRASAISASRSGPSARARFSPLFTLRHLLPEALENSSRWLS